MQARLVTIAAAVLMLGARVAAEPPKAPAPQSSASRAHAAPAPLVLASADHVAAPGDESTTAPVHHRAARATTCRCGGEPQPDSQEEQP